MRPYFAILLWCARLYGEPVCNQPASDASLTIPLPSSPFGVAVSADGCVVFASLTGKNGGIAVLKRGDGKVELSRFIPLHAGATGIALTHDGKLLIAAADLETFFLDTRRMVSGALDPVLGKLSDGLTAGSVYVNVTADDKLLFVSDERARSITVVDLARARAGGYKAGAIVGKIPVGHAPVALTFSRDGKWLYTTSQRALDDWNWPKVCKPEVGTPANAGALLPEGAVIVVDVERAARDPEHSVAGRIPSGCNPVRMALSPGGDRIYVTARGSDSLLSFDTETLLKDPSHALIAKVPASGSPVPVAVIDHGKKLVVGGSNRFGNFRQAQSLTVLDAARLGDGAAAVLGTIPAGAFPREMAVSSDGRTLFLTNYGSNSLQVIDLEHLPLAP